MKLSVLPVSFFSQLTTQQMSVAKWARTAQDLGADGFDVSIMFYPNSTPTLIQRMKQEMKDEGVTIQPVMVCDYPDFTNPDPLELDRQVDYFKRNLALVSDLGFQYMRTTAGQNHPGLDIEEASKQVVSYFEKVLPTAEKYGVKLIFENHSKPGAWPLIDFSFQQEAFYAVYEKMKDLPMGINFDTANAVACGANAKEMLEKIIDKVWTIHLNDTATVGHWTPISIGDGLVNFDEVFEVLNRNNFDGWVCIEEASGRGLEGIESAVKVARKYVK